MKLIFENRLILNPKNSKSNIYLPFNIESGFERMEIHFSYTPKFLEDRNLSQTYIEEGMKKYAPGEFRSGYKTWEYYLPVTNLITLSLDSPEGYVGCAHRHNPEQMHILSESFGSPGFVAVNLTGGIWQAVINVHAVVTENCNCILKIIGFSGREGSI